MFILPMRARVKRSALLGMLTCLGVLASPDLVCDAHSRGSGGEVLLIGEPESEARKT